MKVVSLIVLLSLAGCTGCGPAGGQPPAENGTTPPHALETIAEGDTEAVFARVAAWAEGEELHLRPFGDVIQRTAEQFLGAPYLEGQLDRGDREVLVLNLEGFDCVLYVESVLALARGFARQDYAFDSFVSRIEEQRYRGGTLDGYCSRLHYFTEWIADNEARGIVRNITESLGAESERKALNFMGSHRASYTRLRDDSTFACILDREEALKQGNQVFVPQDQIEKIYGLLLPGDIIATSTTIDGMDVSHTGFVYVWPDGGVGLIHASSTGEVRVATDLATYVQGNPKQRGIVVARAVDPRPAEP